MQTRLLLEPVISEKTLRLASTANTYTFLVTTAATKGQVREAIEDMYQVVVERVRTVVSQAEIRRTGRRRLKSRVGKLKKALVTLQSGQTIALFDLGGTAAAA